MRRDFFTIYVDGVKYDTYNANEWNWIDVGGGSSEVCVPWANEKLISIHPMSAGDFVVEVHGNNLIVVTYKYREVMQALGGAGCTRREACVRSGSLMKIMGHTIQAVDIPIPHPFGSGCWTCGQGEECTCFVS
jgi:hypothetical protein